MSSGIPDNEESVKDYINEAISIAHHAIHAEEMLDRIRAYSLYRECSQRLEHITPFVDSCHSEVLSKFSKVYLERSERLRKEIEMAQEKTEEKDDDEVKDDDWSSPSVEFVVVNKFVELEIPPYPEDRKELSEMKFSRRPFQMIKILLQSMKKGALLTRDVYIPKDVWFQKGVQEKCLSNLGAKVTFLEKTIQLLNDLEQLEILDFGDVDLVVEKLGLFLAKFEQESDLLSSSIHQGKNSKKILGLGKSLYSKMFSSKKEENQTKAYPYIPTLLKVFERSLFLESWIERAEEDENLSDIKVMLDKICYFLSIRLCSFALYDLNLLMSTYLRASTSTL